MDLGLRDKAIVVVGGTSGIGRATAELLVADGAHVAVIGRDPERTRGVAEELSTSGGTVIGLAADGRWADGTSGSRVGGVHRAIDKAAEELGGLDGLAVTAGPVTAHGAFCSFTDHDWEEYFQSILMTTVRSARAAVPHLLERGRGVMVLTGAYSVRAPKPALLPYVAMKCAVVAVAKSLALELGPHRVRVNCVCPGAVATEALDEAKAAGVARYGGDPEEALDRIMREDWGMDVALGRVGRPLELAELYAFLLSERAGYLTGAVLNADGGTHF